MASLIGTAQIDLAHPPRAGAASTQRAWRQSSSASAAGRDRHIEILIPSGRHNLAVGLDLDTATIDIRGHAGYFIAGMNQRASDDGTRQRGLERGREHDVGHVRVKGNASECAAASGHGGLVVIEGDASSRCGISMKGCDIVVRGDVGHASAFMAQAGRLVVCGDAGARAGRFAVRSRDLCARQIHGLGADARRRANERRQNRALSTRCSLAPTGTIHWTIQRPASAYHRIAS